MFWRKVKICPFDENRYGLPVNFQAAIMEPQKNAQKRLRTELNKLYQHLDGTASGPIEVGFNLVRFIFCPDALFQTFEDAPTLVSLGVHDYFPYVFFKMNIDFLEKRQWNKISLLLAV